MIKRNLKPLLLSGGVLALLIFLHAIAVLEPLEMFSLRLLKPALGFSYRMGSEVKSFWLTQSERRDWQAEASNLRQTMNVLIQENVRLKQLEAENQDLRDHLHFIDSKKKKFVMANIISGGDASLINEQLVLDKGAKAGLFVGLPVTSSNGQVVGKIIDIDSESAHICLVNQTECQFAGAIQNESKTAGIVHGDLGLTIKMDYIPQSENIKPGQIVVTSGLEKNVVRGQVLGQVVEVAKENNALWQTAKIESLVDLANLTTVSIILP